RLLGQGEPEFFNYRIGQNFAGDALDLRLGFIVGKAPIERQFEILSLAHAFQAFIAHLFQRTLDGFALRVKDSFLQRNVDVGCHKRRLYVTETTDSDEGSSSSLGSASLRWQCLQPFIQYRKRILKKFLMAWILAGFELLKYAPSRQFKVLP